MWLKLCNSAIQCCQSPRLQTHLCTSAYPIPEQDHHPSRTWLSTAFGPSPELYSLTDGSPGRALPCGVWITPLLHFWFFFNSSRKKVSYLLNTMTTSCLLLGFRTGVVTGVSFLEGRYCSAYKGDRVTCQS